MNLCNAMEIQCDICKKVSFEGQVKLMVHQIYECEENVKEKVMCLFCNQLFTKDQYLSSHTSQYCLKLTSVIEDLQNQNRRLQDDIRIKDTKIAELH